VGLIKGYLSRNQIEFCESETVNASDVPESELSLRAVASKLSMSGGQGFFHCNCKSGTFTCETTPLIFLGSVGPLSTVEIGITTLSLFLRTVCRCLVILVSESTKQN
jgi:hypothetical protein